MDPSPVIAVQGLTRRFGDVVAVNALDLQIFPGEVFGMLGHNGAGKTTTIRLLNGVLNPHAGQMVVLGLSPTEQGPLLRRRTGVLTETHSLDERLTGYENLAIYAELYDVPRAQIAGRIAELLDFFELQERGGEKVSAYSRGMQQRLALCRALLHRPDLLFLDEPTSGLDPVSARHVLDLIHRLSREEGRTVFLCTHNLAEAQRGCDRVGVMEHGRLLAVGTPDALAEQLGMHPQIEIEVEPAQQTAAVDVLTRQGGARADAQAPGLICISGVARERIPTLLEMLFAAQIRLYRVAPQPISLENIYFALHAEEKA